MTAEAANAGKGPWTWMFNAEHMRKVAGALKIRTTGAESKQDLYVLISRQQSEWSVAEVAKLAKELGCDTTVPYDAMVADIAAQEGGEDRVASIELVTCDKCMGMSTGSVPLEVCPYCADGAEIGEPVKKSAPKPVAVRLVDAPSREVPAAKAPPPPTSEAPTAPPAGKKGKKPPSLVQAAQQAAAVASAEVVVVDDTRPSSALATTKELDALVEQVRTLKVSAAINGWRIGRVVNEIVDRGLWQLRVDGKGEQRYKTPEAFFLAETGMTRASYEDLQKVARDHGEKAIETWGTKKFLLTMRAPAELVPAIQQRVLEGASRSEIEAEIKRANQGRKARDASGKMQPKTRKPGAGPKPKVEKIAVAALLGTHQVNLYKKPSNRKMELENCVAAKHMADVPWGRWELENGTTMYFTLGTKTDGTMKLSVNVRREGEED